MITLNVQESMRFMRCRRSDCLEPVTTYTIPLAVSLDGGAPLDVNRNITSEPGTGASYAPTVFFRRDE